MNEAKPNKDTTPDHEETLGERSARLEAEAAALSQKKAYTEHDPLMPEPLAEQPQHPNQDESAKGHAVITALQDELDKAKDQALRAAAEVENIRRRAQKERQDASKYAVSGFAKDLLEVSDNLRRALEAIPQELLGADPAFKNLFDGIEATERALLRAFDKHGIQKIEPLDQPFDPNFHEVMFEAPIPGKPAGLVMQVMEPGYILHDRLIRPARVGVTKDDGSSASGNEDLMPPGGHIDTQA